MAVALMALSLLAPIPAPRDVDPTTLPVLTTWYDPRLGGINCAGDCSTFGGGARIRPEHYGASAACLTEWRGATVDIAGFGRFVCRDSGGAVRVKWTEAYGLVVSVDILSETPLQPGPHREWRLVREGDDVSGSVVLSGMGVLMRRAARHPLYQERAVWQGGRR